MSNVAELPTKDTITLIVNNKNIDKVTYIFKNENGNKIGEYENKSPATLSSQSNIAKQFKQIIDPKGDLKSSSVNNQFAELKELLQIKYESALSVIEQEKVDELREQQENDMVKLKEATDKLKSLDQPLIYFGSLIDWFTAGERNNILYAFIAYAGQIILRNPISVIALGESGSGKSHIQEVSLSLIPQRHVVNEKKITEAALFNRSRKDKHFYEGKIVNYGDMGGSKDHEFMEESKNLMKELQSDGYINKPLSVPDGEGGWDVQDLELVGSPCLSYTTVPNHVFDEQEMSRSIFITPRMDNQQIFNRRKSALEFKFGKSYKYLKCYEKEAELIPYMLLHLHKVFKDITIINPYSYFVINFLKDSAFYKRDFEKFSGLLKTITALNFYKHDLHDIEGNKVILTSIEDVQLFMSLLKPYKESITANVSPKAMEVLNDIRNNIENWKQNAKREVLDAGITTNEYFNLQNLGLSKASVKKYMYELAEKGFIIVTTHSGRANVYDLADSEQVVINYDLQHIDDEVYDNIKYEAGEWIVDIMKKDEYNDGLDVMNFDDHVKKPRWI